jgi:flagellar motor protein MotB
VATGCAAQDKFDHTVSANRSLKEQLATAQSERDQYRADLEAVQDQLSESRTSYATLQTRYEELEGSVANLDQANDDYMRRIAQLEIGPLPAEVETAIADLARAHPEVLTFDPQMGLVRFSSDFTFDLGSTKLREDASTTLTSLAAILNEPAATSLEARIIGHTDNVPIRRADTRRQHPTNMHLSVHRAIAVADALTDASVDPGRIQVAGYGEHRPMVPNGRGGATANRRVEIFLAPMGTPAEAAASVPTDVAPGGIEPNK